MTYYRKTDRIRPAEHCRKISEANSSGIYETPWGYFSSPYKAVAALDLNISPTAIFTMCRNADRAITRQAYRRNVFLHTMGPWVIGRTYRQIGFCFEPKQK